MKDIWRQKIHCAVSYYTSRDRLRGEGEGGVGSVPMVQCKIEKLSEVAGC